MSGTESNKKHAGALHEKLIEEQARNQQETRKALKALRDSIEDGGEATNPAILRLDLSPPNAHRPGGWRESIRPTKAKVTLAAIISFLITAVVALLSALREAGILK